MSHDELQWHQNGDGWSGFCRRASYYDCGVQPSPRGGYRVRIMLGNSIRATPTGREARDWCEAQLARLEIDHGSPAPQQALTWEVVGEEAWHARYRGGRCRYILHVHQVEPGRYTPLVLLASPIAGFASADEAKAWCAAMVDHLEQVII